MRLKLCSFHAINITASLLLKIKIMVTEVLERYEHFLNAKMWLMAVIILKG